MDSLIILSLFLGGVGTLLSIINTCMRYKDFKTTVNIQLEIGQQRIYRFKDSGELGAVFSKNINSKSNVEAEAADCVSREVLVCVRANRACEKDITLLNQGIEVPEKSKHIPLKSGFPKLVEFPFPLHKEPCSVYITPQSLAESLKDLGLLGVVKIRGYSKDINDRLYTGKKVKFDIEKWSQEIP